MRSGWRWEAVPIVGELQKQDSHVESGKAFSSFKALNASSSEI